MTKRHHSKRHVKRKETWIIVTAFLVLGLGLILYAILTEEKPEEIDELVLDQTVLTTEKAASTPVPDVHWSTNKGTEVNQASLDTATEKISDDASPYEQTERKAFYCGPARQYTKLIDAISAAEKYMGSILYVDAGTYDLAEELGDDYFAGFTAEGISGIELKNRIHIVFSASSRVVCHYTGDNTKVLEKFSPFVCGPFGFTVENLSLDVSGTRCAISDERTDGNEQCQTHYINCNIKLDNSQNPACKSYSCISGQLGPNHDVLIESCTFESVAGDGIEVHGTVRYDLSDDAWKMVVKDNYFVSGTLELSGSPANASVIVTNNSFVYDASNDATGIYCSGDRQVSIRAWNNEIRQ